MLHPICSSPSNVFYRLEKVGKMKTVSIIIVFFCKCIKKLWEDSQETNNDGARLDEVVEIGQIGTGE